MADPGFPGQHTTTTTVTNTNISVERTLRFDKSYIRTIPGMLKIGEIVLNLLGFICIEVSGKHSLSSDGSWFNFVALFAFWFTLFLLVFYLFHIIEKTYKIPWLKIEFGYCALWSFLYLIAGCCAATYGLPAFGAAAFFGLSAMVVYAVDAYLKFVAIKNGELAQGDRVITKETTTTVRSPAY